MFGLGESWISNICLQQSDSDPATVSALLHLMQIVEGHSVHGTAVRPHHDIKMHGHINHARTEQLAIRDSNRDSRQLLTVHTQASLIVLIHTVVR